MKTIIVITAMLLNANSLFGQWVAVNDSSKVYIDTTSFAYNQVQDTLYMSFKQLKLKTNCHKSINKIRISDVDRLELGVLYYYNTKNALSVFDMTSGSDHYIVYDYAKRWLERQKALESKRR